MKTTSSFESRQWQWADCSSPRYLCWTSVVDE
jgi:hypothetical protein